MRTVALLAPFRTRLRFKGIDGAGAPLFSPPIFFRGEGRDAGQRCHQATAHAREQAREGRRGDRGAARARGERSGQGRGGDLGHQRVRRGAPRVIQSPLSPELVTRQIIRAAG